MDFPSASFDSSTSSPCMCPANQRFPAASHLPSHMLHTHLPPKSTNLPLWKNHISLPHCRNSTNLLPPTNPGHHPRPHHHPSVHPRKRPSPHLSLHPCHLPLRHLGPHHTLLPAHHLLPLHLLCGGTYRKCCWYGNAISAIQCGSLTPLQPLPMHHWHVAHQRSRLLLTSASRMQCSTWHALAPCVLLQHLALTNVLHSSALTYSPVPAGAPQSQAVLEAASCLLWPPTW
jgi:hypothetical protein